MTVAVHAAMDGRPVTRRPDRARRRRAASDPRRARRPPITGTRLDEAAIAAAAAAAAEECEPFTDAIATDWYRRRMVGLFVGRALARAGPARAGREA